MNEKKYRALMNIFDAEQKYFSEAESLLGKRSKKTRLGMVLNSLARITFTKALWLYFVKQELHGFKQECYVASKLCLASIGKDGGEKFESMTSFFVALLSDNKEVINEFSHLSIPVMSKVERGSLPFEWWCRMTQLAIRGEFHELEEEALSASEYVRSQNDKDLCKFFILFSKKDVAGLQQFIQAKRVGIRSADPRIEKLMSWIGLFEAKMCWLVGMEVNIDHPSIPMELVRVEPLAEYSDRYDFARIEGSARTWVDKLVDWIKAKK